MRQRLISAAVLVPVVVLVFWLGDIWLSLGITVLAIAAAWEASRLARGAGLPAITWMALTAPVLAALAFETVFLPALPPDLHHTHEFDRFRHIHV